MIKAGLGAIICFWSVSLVAVVKSEMSPEDKLGALFLLATSGSIAIGVYIGNLGP